MSVAGGVSKFFKGEWLGSRKISKIFIVTTHQLLGKFSQNLHQKPRCEQEAKNFEESASPTNTNNNDTSSHLNMATIVRIHTPKSSHPNSHLLLKRF